MLHGPETTRQLLLTAGTYSTLPSRIEEYAGPHHSALPPDRQRQLERQLDHMIYEHLLKVRASSCTRGARIKCKQRQFPVNAEEFGLRQRCQV